MRKNATAGWIGLLLTIAGIGVGAYLTISHYTESVTLACPENAVVNCVKVTTSQYSAISGVPLALMGLVYFIILMAFFLPPLWFSRSLLVHRARVLLVTAGMLMVLWLVYVELFLLGTMCLYCTILHVLIFLLFVLTLLFTPARPISES